MVTLKDIARELNLSYSTVSLCLSSSPRVSARTMELVKATARRMGYAPNARARAFVNRKTRLIGIVVPDIANPFFSAITRGAEAAATERDFRVLILNTDRRIDLETRHIRLISEGQVDGLLVTSIHTRSATLDTILAQNHPVVFVNNPYPTADVSFVGSDGFATGRLAADHLIELGHRMIAVCGVENETEFQRRLMTGFLQSLADHQIEWSNANRLNGQFSVESGYESGVQIVRRLPGCTAVFAFDDLIALGVMRALEENGRRIPQDVSLVGCDDIFLSSLPRISLTTVRQQTNEMGRIAMTMLLDEISGAGARRTIRDRQIILPSELVIRGTTASID